MEIKQLIYDQRKRLGYTLEGLAKMVGVSKQTVQKWESGKIGDMKRSNIAALSTALNIPIEILVGIESDFESYVPLTHHEGKVVTAYRDKPLIQPAVDKLLDVEPEKETAPSNDDAVLSVAARGTARTDEQFDEIFNAEDTLERSTD
ncbi:MAG: helix-turn-helix transcriptional regulator [Clostridia bacterium]|nr:helix-turn-helix transcriptional regulator [Clostridia bacterium]